MEELKQRLIEACNNSGLPLEAIVFVTKDLWRDAEDTLKSMKESAMAAQAVNQGNFEQPQEEAEVEKVEGEPIEIKEVE